MSIPANPYAGAAPGAYPYAAEATLRARTKDSLAARGLSWTGIVFFLVTLLVPLSTDPNRRVPVMGLGVHPYLLLLAPLLIYVLFFRLRQFPTRSLVALLIFVAMFGFSTLGGGGAVQETMKVAASAATLLTAALMIRSDQDFRLCSLGMVAGISLLTVYGLIRGYGGFIGVDVIGGTNENALSLYTLPAMLLAGYVALDDKAAKWLRIAMAVGILMLAVGTFSSANRSGWLGAIVVGLELMLLRRGRSLRTMMLVGLLVGLAYLAFLNFGNIQTFNLRLSEMQQGRTTDIERVHLFLATVEIALANPLLGVSPQAVRAEIGRVMQLGGAIDAHNVVGYLIAGSGLITSAALLYLAWSLFRRPPGVPKLTGKARGKAAISPHRLLQMMLVLWLVRGMFSREILVAPNFNIGVGLVIGLCIAHGIWQVQRRTAPQTTAYAPRPAGA